MDEKFKKLNKLKDAKWITVNGTHIPLKEGERPKDAIDRKFNNNDAIKKEHNRNYADKSVERVNLSKARMQVLVNDIINFKPITMKINNRTIVAEFDKYSAKKNVYGTGNSDFDGFRYKLKNIDKLPEYIQTSKYNRSKHETGKDSKQHKGVKEWHYFINQIATDKGIFDITVNVRDKGQSQYIYEVAFNKKKI